MGKIVYTQGSFDVFHYGHVNFLKRCSKLGAVRVALLTDESFEAYRGYSPVYSFGQRYQVLWSCKYVDTVVSSDNRETKKEIAACNADIVAIGTDWVKKDLYKQS